MKGTEARFAHALATLMNELGAEGWEYQRAESLPCEERRTLGGARESTQHVLVFRREKGYRAPSLGAFKGTGEGEGKPGASRLILEGAKRD